MDKRNRTENPEMDLQLCGQLIFNKARKNIQWKKDKWCWEHWKASCKRMKLDDSVIPYPKRNSKWIQDLNVR